MSGVSDLKVTCRRGELSLVVVLLLAGFPLLAQISSPGNAPPPKANPQTILDRAVEMYESKKYATALLAFQEAAAAGKTEAASYLGVMYSAGQGTAINYDEAMTWLRKAAAAGDSQAMCNVGVLFYQGLGVPHRPDLARQWFLRAANGGNNQAMFNVGAMYRDGAGGPADPAEAM